MGRTHKPPQMKMSKFWEELRQLPGQGWKASVTLSRILTLNPPPDPNKPYYGCGFDPITAIAYAKGFGICDWQMSAEKLGLSKGDANKIKGASRNITPAEISLKKTRMKMFRALGLNLEHYRDNAKLGL